MEGFKCLFFYDYRRQQNIHVYTLQPDVDVGCES